MELEGNFARFTAEELAAMRHRYPEVTSIELIDTEALMGGIEELKAEHTRHREERRVRAARWLPPAESTEVGDTTEDAFRIAEDRTLISGIVDQIHAHRLGVSLDGPTDGIPND